MASRRKYQAHRPAVDVENVAVVPGPEPAAPMHGGTPDMPPAPADDDALLRAAAATRHAEELQRQHAMRQQMGLQEPELTPEQRQQVDSYVDSIQDISAHKARFLKSHPSLLQPPYSDLMKHAYMIALHARIPDDTPEMDQAILAGIARDLDHHRALSAMTFAQARPTPENHQAHHDAGQAAEELQREAEAHLAEMGAAAPAQPPPQPRRSIPMSAPVARNIPTGHRQPSDWNTLSAEERQIARNSFSAPGMSNEQKELLYLQNKRKHLRMKADGSYSDQGGR